MRVKERMDGRNNQLQSRKMGHDKRLILAQFNSMTSAKKVMPS